MSDSESDGEFVYYGTPLAAPEEVTRRHEFQKTEVKDTTVVQSLPVWKQEAVDSEGRQRFHGAFTGGFSAGYYNTAGSEKGWTPSSFRSSRSDRNGPRKQQVADFLDEDEAAEASAAAPR
eukprot:CAMPEP_0206143200 /NCGR_PEP_ID=MMETSP1473-20131121/19616_1 /ASSEMBLY_ACC=CAM_ASM_001109 /TAXON_ID=1461547 /ORGANISM="Stichococcus sp, Strain RCC1054" /LENGTH=119 /DNA_ID=CAMNT_0053538495 /DNA_START=458 /DNA_END=813 /DNA_ORIENTATION=-